MRDTILASTPTVQPFKMGFLLAAGGTSLFALKSIFVKLAYTQGVDTTQYFNSLAKALIT